MLPLGRYVVASRKFLYEFDVRSESRASKNTFEKIVAEQSVFWNTASEGRLEGIYVVDAFPGIGALTEEVLVYVGDSCGIGIQATRTGKDALIE